LKLCKVNQVQDVNQENLAKIGTNDNVKNHLIQALQLIEKQQMFIANQTVHYQKVIDTQNKVIDKPTKGVTEELCDQLDDFTGKLTLTVNITNHSLVFTYLSQHHLLSAIT
jgi:preprotein translocase subunit SecA